MAIPVTSLIGANLTRTDTTAMFPLGTTMNLTDGSQAVYVQALSEISTYAAVGIYANGTAQMLTTTIAGNTKRFAVAQTSIASAAYGWVQTGGKLICHIAASCAQSALLFTTGTSGVLDDATVSNCLVAGVVLDTTLAVGSISAATDATINCGAAFISFFSNPA